METLTRVAAGTPQRPPSRPSRLLGAGLIVGPLFTAAYLIEGVLRGHGYSALRHPVSSLALGSQGWEQIANFELGGLLVVLFAIGLRRSLRPGPGAVAVPVLVAVWGVGLIGAGAFVTDPVGGYPTAASPVTWHGQVHDLAFSLPGFAALTVAMLTAAVALARRRSGWFAVYSGLSAIAFAAMFALATMGFANASDTAGLWQRLCVSVGWLWLALLAILAGRLGARRATLERLDP
jgi:Protein of unknown function (DUF998)